MMSNSSDVDLKAIVESCETNVLMPFLQAHPDSLVDLMKATRTPLQVRFVAITAIRHKSSARRKAEVLKAALCTNLPKKGPITLRTILADIENASRENNSD